MYASDKVAGQAYGAQTVGYSSGESTAPRQTEVEGENMRLAQTVEQLCMLADSLSGRLIPVRRKTGGNLASGKEPTQPEPVLCELATLTRLRRQGIEQAIGILQTALNELEI